MTGPARFEATDGGDLPALLEGLGRRLGVEVDAPVTQERTVYDTFDWRLHGHGSVLEHWTGGGAPPELRWRSLRTGEVLASLPIDDVPRFAWDLPASPLRDRLSGVVEMRALLPLVRGPVRRRVLRVLDDEAKTVVRVVAEEPARRAAGQGPVVTVVPVRGYEARAEQVGELLAAQVWLRPSGEDPAVAALRRAGYDPGAYSSKLRLALDPEAPAAGTWVEVLRALFATVVANEAGMRDDTDSEFLHDYRVAVRRTRSVLGQAKGVLPPGLLDRFRPEFAWLGQATGPTRDYDVYLLDLPAFTAGLPPERRHDLKPFASFLERRQREAHAALVTELGTPRYRRLLDGWRRALDGATDEAAADPAGAPDATRPSGPVAAGRIARAHRRVIRDGRRIDAMTHPEALHDLRKDAKKLRYAFECFGSLFPAELTSPAVRELKGLQDVLGTYQDCQVQAASLERFAQEMLDDGEAQAPALLAMGHLVDQLGERERRARREFHDRFERFDAAPVRRAVRALADGAVAGGSATR